MVTTKAPPRQRSQAVDLWYELWPVTEQGLVKPAWCIEHPKDIAPIYMVEVLAPDVKLALDLAFEAIFGCLPEDLDPQTKEDLSSDLKIYRIR